MHSIHNYQFLLIYKLKSTTTNTAMQRNGIIKDYYYAYALEPLVCNKVGYNIQTIVSKR